LLTGRERGGVCVIYKGGNAEDASRKESYVSEKVVASIVNGYTMSAEGKLALRCGGG